jgi:hypothetical protein
MMPRYKPNPFSLKGRPNGQQRNDNVTVFPTSILTTAASTAVTPITGADIAAVFSTPQVPRYPRPLIHVSQTAQTLAGAPEPSSSRSSSTLTSSSSSSSSQSEPAKRRLLSARRVVYRGNITSQIRHESERFTERQSASACDTFGSLIRSAERSFISTPSRFLPRPPRVAPRTRPDSESACRMCTSFISDTVDAVLCEAANCLFTVCYTCAGVPSGGNAADLPPLWCPRHTPRDPPCRLPKSIQIRHTATALRTARRFPDLDAI